MPFQQYVVIAGTECNTVPATQQLKLYLCLLIFMNDINYLFSLKTVQQLVSVELTLSLTEQKHVQLTHNG